MYLILSLIILSLMFFVVATIKLRAQKNTALKAMFGLALIVVACVEADSYRLFERVILRRSFVSALFVLTVVEVFLRIRSKFESKQNFIDRNYVKNLGSDFEAEVNAYYASLKIGADFNSYCMKNRIKSHQIKLQENRRHTVGQPLEPSGRIFILGGSTVFNAHVPDWNTISSLLQRKLNAKECNYSVINLGKSGATTTDRIKLLKDEETLRKGDAVVIYFGINDAYYSGRAFDYKNNPIDLILVSINLAQNLAARYFWCFGKTPRISKVGTKRNVEKYINDQVIVLIRELSVHCENLGVKFMAVLQPSAFSCRSICRMDRNYLNGFANSPERALQIANKTISRELCNDQYFVDARGIFENAIDAVYVDWCHTTAFGNALLSDFFFTQLVKLGVFEGKHFR
jgi:lysophospholipase L1-like esterase